MKKTKPHIILTVIVNSHNKKQLSPSIESVPKVKMNATYEVGATRDITYAEGLCHSSINSPNYIRKRLKLDVYEPNNKQKNRPAYMFIHGGNFINGTKQQEEIIELAHFYTSRGWVFIAIDYRLSADFGTVPQEWLNYALHVPSERISQFLALYPAQRDAKAAMRWLVENAETYGINKDYITIGGASAGAITAISIGISNQEDFRDEIDIKKDPTLSTSNLNQRYSVKTIVNYWGSKIGLDLLENIYDKSYFNSKMPPLFIVHGTEDPTIPFSHAKDLKALYMAHKAPLACYPIHGAGHAVWDAKVAEERIETLTFQFMVAQQQLIVS